MCLTILQLEETIQGLFLKNNVSYVCPLSITYLCNCSVSSQIEYAFVL